MASRSRNSTAARGPRPLTGTRLLEALIGGWRPLARLDVEGFALLRSRGITRRANSAVALEVPADRDALEQAVSRVEALTQSAGAAPTFRILREHGPAAELDTLLEGRGYSAEGHSRILERALDPARLPAPHPQAVIRTGGLDEDWFDGAWRLAPREGEDARRTVRDIMAGSPAIQLSLPAGSDAVAAVGRAALVETGRTSAAVLNHIAVAEEHRRQGLGTAVVGSLLTLAAAQGADRALLEVETTDTGQAAARMYRGLGLRPLGAHHYRVRPEGATR